ncbi:unnamed protein product [Cochlearia groenlandica]
MQTLSIAFCNCALFYRRNNLNPSFISSSSPPSSSPSSLICRAKSQTHIDSLRVLEWDKLCDVVASFARTSLGRQATKVESGIVQAKRMISLRADQALEVASLLRFFDNLQIDF